MTRARNTWDHTAAVQLPAGLYNEAGALAGEKFLVRTDSAGASRKFLWHKPATISDRHEKSGLGGRD